MPLPAARLVFISSMSLTVLAQDWSWTYGNEFLDSGARPENHGLRRGRKRAQSFRGRRRGVSGRDPWGRGGSPKKTVAAGVLRAKTGSGHGAAEVGREQFRRALYALPKNCDFILKTVTHAIDVKMTC